MYFNIIRSLQYGSDMHCLEKLGMLGDVGVALGLQGSGDGAY